MTQEGLAARDNFFIYKNTKCELLRFKVSSTWVEILMGELFPGKRLKNVLGLLRRLESYNSLIFTTDVKISVAVVWNGEMRLAAALLPNA